MYHLWLFWLTRAEVSTSTQTVSPTKPKITTIWFVFLFLGKICQPLFYTSNIKIKAKCNSIFKNHKKTKSEPWISFNCPVQFFLIDFFFNFLFLYFSCVPHSEPFSLLPPHLIDFLNHIKKRKKTKEKA